MSVSTEIQLAPADWYRDAISAGSSSILRFPFDGDRLLISAMTERPDWELIAVTKSLGVFFCNARSNNSANERLSVEDRSLWKARMSSR